MHQSLGEPREVWRTLRLLSSRRRMSRASCPRKVWKGGRRIVLLTAHSDSPALSEDSGVPEATEMPIVDSEVWGSQPEVIAGHCPVPEALGRLEPMPRHTALALIKLMHARRKVRTSGNLLKRSIASAETAV